MIESTLLRVLDQQPGATHAPTLGFWMANASELLHFLKSDRHITAFSLQVTWHRRCHRFDLGFIELNFSGSRHVGRCGAHCFQESCTSPPRRTQACPAQPPHRTGCPYHKSCQAIPTLPLCRIRRVSRAQQGSSVFSALRWVCSGLIFS